VHEHVRPGIRHDLKTYLNHIVGYCDILIEDAKEYKRFDLIPGIEQILAWADKIKRLINFHFDKNTDTSFGNMDEIKKSFYLPLMQIITDARRLIVLYRAKAPNFVKDMEQLLSVAISMYDLIEAQLIDLQIDMTLAEKSSLGSSEIKSLENVDFLYEADESIPAFDDLEFMDTVQGERARIPANILVIDDDQVSQMLIARHLSALGHKVTSASSGPEAFEFLSHDNQVDIIILDVLIPEISGVQILRVLKKELSFNKIPVIMMSAVDSSASIAQCIKLGAEDYLPKEFDTVILRARIDACLEKKHLHEQQEIFLQALLESQQTLANELMDAGNYIVSLLPKSMTYPLQTNILLLPSTELGGDFCSCHMLDSEHVSLYLLDVSGHGIKSALLAVSISNLLRNKALTDTDFYNPGAVLASLNDHFQIGMENSLFFTIWYGVYHVPSKKLLFAAGGAPPACIVRNSEVIQLKTGDLLLGASTEFDYQTHEVGMQSGDRLFMFSDGIYEVSRSNGKIYGLQDFMRLLPLQNKTPEEDLDNLITNVLGISMTDQFQDDVCLFEAIFS